MSEFKFACPVCGQHITADSSNAGGKIECPTCYRKIVVPQAPTSADSKLIISAAQADKVKPPTTLIENPFAAQTARKGIPVMAILFVVVLAAAAGTTFAYRKKIFNSSSDQAQTSTNNSRRISSPRTSYPIPTDVRWTLDLTNLSFPNITAAGSIHGSGFKCERATLTGGTLTLRQGKSGPADLGITVHLFAQQGEELRNKSIEIPADRLPPLPKVVLRWKDDQDKAVTHNVTQGYALKLAFGEPADGVMPGKIFICLPDAAKSFVAGTFDAEIKKPPPPKPKQPKTK